MIAVNAARALSNGWKQITTGSVNRRIFKALIIVGGITFGVKLATVGKEVVIARTFGTSDSLEAFLIASTLPMYIISIVGGSFNASLIPIYIHVRESEGEAAAQRLLSNIVILSVALLAILIAFLGSMGSYILPFLGSNFKPDKLALTYNLFYTLLPLIVIAGVMTLWNSVLNAVEHFAVTSVAPIMVPIASIASLFIMARTWGIYALVFGTIFGYLLHLALLVWKLKRQGIILLPRWYGLEPNTRKVIRQYLPMVAGSIIMGSTVLVDQAMAAMLEPGSVAILNYGNRVVALFIGVGTFALGTAVLPYFSKMVALGDWGGIRRSFKLYSYLILLVTVPLTILAYMFSRPLVQLLFEGGRFTSADTVAVSRVQAMYLLQVPFYSLGILCVRLISSLQANHILMWGTVINVAVNIVLDLVLMRIFGVAGIALSTSLVYAVSCGFLITMLHKKLNEVTY
jgi:putative peptidoglycan lipid II flippase